MKCGKMTRGNLKFWGKMRDWGRALRLSEGCRSIDELWTNECQ